MKEKTQEYFQDSMPGNVCFGCGNDNHDGLQIKSFWEGEEAVCIWQSEEKIAVSKIFNPESSPLSLIVIVWVLLWLMRTDWKTGR